MTLGTWAIGTALALCLALLLAAAYYTYTRRNSAGSWPARLVAALGGGSGGVDEEGRRAKEEGERRTATVTRTAEAAAREQDGTMAVVLQLRDVLLHAQEQGDRRDQRDAHAQERMAEALQRLREDTARSSSALASASSAAAEAAAAVASAVEQARAQGQAHAQAQADSDGHVVRGARALHVPDGQDGVSCRPGTRQAVPPGFRLFEQPYLVRVTAANYDVETGVLSVPINRRNCHMLELVQATMPRLMYTVNAFCDTLTVYAGADADDDGDKTAYGEYVVTLAAGDYTYTTLADELQSRIDASTETTSGAAFGLTVRSMTVSFDINTQKYTFSLATSTGALQRFYLKFPKPDLAYMLGFGFRDLFPHYTTVEDDSAVTHVVVDGERDPSEAVAVPAVSISHPSIRLADARTTIAKVVLGAVTAVASSGRADLFGGRYVSLTCDDLRQRYSNDSTVAWISQASDVNVVDLIEGSATFRRFPQPMPLDVLAMKLWIHLPTGKVAAADTSLLSFQLRFLTVFDNVTLRYDGYVPDKYD